MTNTNRMPRLKSFANRIANGEIITDKTDFALFLGDVNYAISLLPEMCAGCNEVDCVCDPKEVVVATPPPSEGRTEAKDTINFWGREEIEKFVSCVKNKDANDFIDRWGYQQAIGMGSASIDLREKLRGELLFILQSYASMKVAEETKRKEYWIAQATSAQSERDRLKMELEQLKAAKGEGFSDDDIQKYVNDEADGGETCSPDFYIGVEDGMKEMRDRMMPLIGNNNKPDDKFDAIELIEWIGKNYPNQGKRNDGKRYWDKGFFADDFGKSLTNDQLYAIFLDREK